MRPAGTCSSDAGGDGGGDEDGGITGPVSSSSSAGRLREPAGDEATAPGAGLFGELELVRLGWDAILMRDERSL